MTDYMAMTIAMVSYRVLEEVLPSAVQSHEQLIPNIYDYYYNNK